MFFPVFNSSNDNYGPSRSLFPNISASASSGPPVIFPPTLYDYLVWLAKVFHKCYNELLIIAPFFTGLSLLLGCSLFIILPLKIINYSYPLPQASSNLLPLSNLSNFNNLKKGFNTKNPPGILSTPY